MYSSVAVSSVAGSSVGQSAVRSVSQHCADGWDKSPPDTGGTCPLPGTVQLSYRVKIISQNHF